MDLQLAYLATPQSAAVVNSAQEAPVAAAQASQAAFAAQLEQRSETVAETPETEGAIIRPDSEGSNAGTYSPRKRRRAYRSDTDEEAITVETAGEKHFIDTTA